MVWAGEPGIGKTVLWEEAVSTAVAAGHLVLVARCFDEERTSALVGLTDLLEQATGDGDAVPARVLDPAADSLGRARDLLSWVRRRARSTPVVLAIDDLQWLDDLSAQTLRHVLRRLVDEPVVVLATTRPDPFDRDPLMLASSLRPGRIDRTTVEAMDRGDLRDLLDAGRPLSPMTLSRIHEASAGNPLYAHELVRVLSDRDVLGLSPELRLPTSITAAMGRRLDVLGPVARRVVDRLAVGGPIQLPALEPQSDDRAHDQGLADALAAGCWWPPVIGSRSPTPSSARPPTAAWILVAGGDCMPSSGGPCRTRTHRPATSPCRPAARTPRWPACSRRRPCGRPTGARRPRPPASPARPSG